MTVVHAASALRDLSEVLRYLQRSDPTITTSFEQRRRNLVTRIGVGPNMLAWRMATIEISLIGT
jgi:hypothetical protein